METPEDDPRLSVQRESWMNFMTNCLMVLSMRKLGSFCRKFTHPSWNPHVG